MSSYETQVKIFTPADFFNDVISSAVPSDIREILKIKNSPEFIKADGIYMAGGLPNPKTFPVDKIMEAMLTIPKRNAPDGYDWETAFQYGPTAGLPQFQETVIKYVKALFESEYGVEIEIPRDEVIIFGGGSQEGIAGIEQVFLDRGDCVAIARYTYLGGAQVFCAKVNGENLYDVISIPMEEDGIDIDWFERELERRKESGEKLPKFVYSVPTFQNPSSAVLSRKKRLKLLDLAERYDFILIEDQPYEALRYEETEPVESIYVLDRKREEVVGKPQTNRVLYLGTFSKVLAPGLRLAFMIAHPEIIAKFELNKQSKNLCSSSFCQVIAGKYIEYVGVEGFLQHIRENAELYKDRVSAFVDAVRRKLPEFEVGMPGGSFFLWGRLPGMEKVADKEIMAREGIAWVRGTPFFTSDPDDSYLRLNPGTFSDQFEDEAEIAAERLANLYDIANGRKPRYPRRKRTPRKTRTISLFQEEYPAHELEEIFEEIERRKKLRNFFEKLYEEKLAGTVV